MIVDLCGNHKSTMRSVARLVALSFLPNPLGAKSVKFKDGNPQNCRVDNLEWIRPKRFCRNRPSSHVEPLQLKDEVWKTVEDTCPEYEVSSLGRVRRLGRTRQKQDGSSVTFQPIILHCKPNRNGSCSVSLHHEGKRILRPVSRLVARSFLGAPNEECRIIHLNGDISDNRATNLAWKPTRRAEEIEERRNALSFKATSHSVDSLIEQWRPIKGYEGVFEVSDFGNIRRVARISQPRDDISLLLTSRLLHPSLRNRRHTIMFRNGLNRLSFYVDRLVAIAFVPNPEHHRFIRHIDGVSSNDRADNLEWTSSHKPHKPHKPVKKRTTTRKKYTKPIRVEDGRGNIGFFSSAYQIFRVLGIPMHYVNDVISGKESGIAGLRFQKVKVKDMVSVPGSKLNDPEKLTTWRQRKIPCVPLRRMILATQSTGTTHLLPLSTVAEQITGVDLPTIHALLRSPDTTFKGWAFRKATEDDLR